MFEDAPDHDRVRDPRDPPHFDFAARTQQRVHLEDLTNTRTHDDRRFAPGEPGSAGETGSTGGSEVKAPSPSATFPSASSAICAGTALKLDAWRAAAP